MVVFFSIYYVIFFSNDICFFLSKYSYFPFVFVSNFNSVHFNLIVGRASGRGEWEGLVQWEGRVM